MARSRVDGGARLRRFLRELDKDVRDPIRQALTDVSQKMLASAQARVPVDTGTLRDELSAKVDSSGLRADVGLRGKRSRRKAFHGLFVEFGTAAHGKHPGTPARPFLHPAFEESKADGLKRVRAAVQESLRRAAAKG